MKRSMRTRPLLAGIALVPLLALSACAHSSSRSTSMDTTGWTTHCFGRFLVDLPPQARVAANYKIWGEEIKKVTMTAGQLSSTIESRERDLKSKNHETEGVMLVRITSHENESASIISWNRPYSTALMRSEAYLVTPNNWAVFQYGGNVAPRKLETAVDFYESLSRNIRSRQPNEIPTEPGFCIDGGYIAGREYMAESFNVGFTMPQHPGMHFSIGASTGAEEDKLLDRIGGFFQTEVLGVAVGLDTLRKRRRPVGPLPGEEYAVAASDKGQRVYSFIWEFQGKDNSLSEPNINVGLTVLERDPDSQGNPPPPAFESDAQALELWDAIIASIRLRPGAV